MAQSHRQLNHSQQEILLILYKFRFATRSLIVNYQELKSPTYTHYRLQNLLQQEYIGRHYDGSYRLQNKEANYFVLPKGVRFLKEKIEVNEPILNLMYKDRIASQRFINHSIEVFKVYCTLKQKHKDNLEFFTKSCLNTYDNFPKPLPDAYISLKGVTTTTHFMMDYFESSTPFFVIRQRIKQYLEYADSADWTETSKFPIVLFVCDTKELRHRVATQVIKEIEDYWAGNVVFAAATIDMLMTNQLIKGVKQPSD